MRDIVHINSWGWVLYSYSSVYGLLHHYLTSFTAPETNCLAILLKLGDELIALLDHVAVLLVLVVWSVCLDDFIDTINRAWNTASCNKVGKVPVQSDIFCLL
jgi:hypothetical protein